MPDMTSKFDIPYPVEGDRPDVPQDMQALADRVDEVLKQHLSGTGGPPQVGDTLPDGTHVAALRHGDVYYQYAP